MVLCGTHGAVVVVVVVVVVVGGVGVGVVVVVVVAAAAAADGCVAASVLKMHGSQATSFGSRCFHQ